MLRNGVGTLGKKVGARKFSGIPHVLVTDLSGAQSDNFAMTECIYIYEYSLISEEWEAGVERKVRWRSLAGHPPPTVSAFHHFLFWF